MRSICQDVPVYITGEGVGKEVSGGRDLPRINTNNVREGMLLVMCEGMLLKAPKLKKYTDQLNLDGWDFLNAYCTSTENDSSDEITFKPKDKSRSFCSNTYNCIYDSNGRIHYCSHTNENRKAR